MQPGVFDEPDVHRIEPACPNKPTGYTINFPSNPVPMTSTFPSVTTPLYTTPYGIVCNKYTTINGLPVNNLDWRRYPSTIKSTSCQMMGNFLNSPWDGL